MAQFLGYLLKCGTNTDNSFIQKDTFESTPNQRAEIKFDLLLIKLTQYQKE